jgi:glycerophosphoryl diester phosphodiesterase
MTIPAILAMKGRHSERNQGTMLNIDRFIGHRGIGAGPIENTLKSLRQAAEAGCRWVEVDVKLTRDLVPVLRHDEELAAGGGEGRIRQMSFEQLKNFDAGEGERIPSLEEALTLVAELGMGINLEIKPAPGLERETAIEGLKLAGRIWPDHLPRPLVSSFKIESLDAAMEVVPHWPRGLLLDRPLPELDSEIKRLKLSSLNLWDRMIDGGSVIFYRDQGLPLLVYTVNDPARARWLFEHGIMAVFTDQPQKLRAALTRQSA